jgi:nitrate reductase gamma subunit
MNPSTVSFIEYELQAIALIWMAVIYTIKAVQLSKLPMPWERGEKSGSPQMGVLKSYGSIFMPWSMESSRKHGGRWLLFGLYHIGALVAIVNTFTMPFAPQFMTETVSMIFAILIAPSVLVGLIKLVQRIVKPELRHISTFDDYFSLVTLEFFLLFGVMALTIATPFWRTWYFLITAFFLFYVPFSKISHYIYFFFAHVLTGWRYGYRGIIPQKTTQS